MKIFIPTRGRIDKQITRVNFPNAIMVVPECEADAWKWCASEYHVVSDDWGINQIRQYILEQEGDHHLVIDDDLHLFRRDRPSKRLKKASWSDIVDMLQWFQSKFDEGYVHGSMGFRVFNNQYEDDELEQENKIATGAHFYRADVVRAEGFRFDALPNKEDIHLTLSMLELGYPNIVTQEWVHHQEYAAGPEHGGIGRYRTPELISESSRTLQQLHPEVVSLRDKDGVVETRIQWKKALGIKEHERKWTM